MTEDRKTQILGKKIIILGCPGSGKSTLARKLHDKTGIPLFHLDSLWWKEDRTHISRELFDRKLETVLRSEEWIIDGDYSRTYETRFAHCDTIVFLDYDEEECLKGIAERIGRKRPDIPWNEDRPDPQLIAEVKSYHMEKRPKVLDLIGKHPDKQVMVFRTREQAQAWLSGIAEENAVKRIGIIGDNCSGRWNRIRSASRGIVISEGRILLCHETETDTWMIPGGGLEGNENEADCCIRETEEETGYLIEVSPCILRIDEYYEKWRYVSFYFKGTVIGTCEKQLTEREARSGMEAVWIPLEDALAIFAEHASYADTDEMKRGIYLRECLALSSLSVPLEKKRETD